jgi:hypothetical protein
MTASTLMLLERAALLRQPFLQLGCPHQYRMLYICVETTQM